ncbi:MAG: hemolysin XhlA family protein [Porphyromonadaceae bacterium]|nr:hemolysin XhlA family protein [Porphyromonadaceae bacterium]
MVCERHLEIIEELDDHEDRIKYLELADTETKTELRNLIKQMEKLVDTIEKFMSNAWRILMGVAGIGIGFIIWYIQQ